MMLGKTQNENACHPDPAIAGEGSLKKTWNVQTTRCDPGSVGEIPRRARDDCLVVIAKAAAA